MAEKILGQFHQLSFNLAVDGVSRFKHRTTNFYPIWMTINEIPLENRFKAENIFLVGVYFGVEKPNMNNLLGAIVGQFHKPEPSIIINIDGQLKAASYILFSLVCDLPAKAAVLNFQGHTAYFGCCSCYIEGTRQENALVFPSTFEQNPRKQEDLVDILNKLHQHPHLKHFQGVKGESVLCQIPYYDLIQDTCLEYMHMQFINTCEKIFSLWQIKTEWKFPEKLLSAEMEKIKLPSSMGAFGLNLEEHPKWKAHSLEILDIVHQFPTFVGKRNAFFMVEPLVMVHSNLFLHVLQKAQWVWCSQICR